MTTTSLFTALLTEHQKEKSRGIFVIPCGVALLYGLYFFALSRRQLLTSWESVLCDLFAMNGLFLSPSLALFASRLGGIEHESGMWERLKTYLPQRRAFAAKLLYGTLRIALLLATLTFLVASLCAGSLGRIPEGDFLHFYGLSLLVSFMVFFLHLTLSIAFSNQAISVLLGVAGSFGGYFLLYLGKPFLYASNPWSLFVGVCFLTMHWDPMDDRGVWYTRESLLPHAPLFVLFWLLVILIFSAHLLSREDTSKVGRPTVAKPGMPRKPNGPTAYRTPSSLSRLPVELQKTRCSPVPLLCLLFPALAALIGTFNYLGNLEILQSRWYSLWSQHTLFLSLLFLPLSLSAMLSWLFRLEEEGHSWEQMLTLVRPRRLILAKARVAALYTFLTITWIFVLFIAAGLLCGFPLSSLPRETLDWYLSGLMGSLALSMALLLLALFLRSLPVTAGLCLVLSIGGWVAAIRFPALSYILPNMLLAVGLRSNNPDQVLIHPLHLLSCCLWIIGSLFLSVIIAERRDAA